MSWDWPTEQSHGRTHSLSSTPLHKLTPSVIRCLGVALPPPVCLQKTVWSGLSHSLHDVTVLSNPICLEWQQCLDGILLPTFSSVLHCSVMSNQFLCCPAQNNIVQMLLSKETQTNYRTAVGGKQGAQQRHSVLWVQQHLFAEWQFILNSLNWNWMTNEIWQTLCLMKKMEMPFICFKLNESGVVVRLAVSLGQGVSGWATIKHPAHAVIW